MDSARRHIVELPAALPNTRQELAHSDSLYVPHSPSQSPSGPWVSPASGTHFGSHSGEKEETDLERGVPKARGSPSRDAVSRRQGSPSQDAKPRHNGSPRGYHKLAEETMGPYPQLSIFRRFGSLNMLNLLSLQAELTHLSVQLKAITTRDDDAPDEVSDYSTSFRSMLEKMRDDSEKYPHGEVPVPEQWRLILTIRDKLNEYNTTLLKISQVTALPRPYKQDLDLLKDSFNETEDGGSFLRGSEFMTWEDTNDLISLNTKRDEDEFTHWFETHPLKWYHWLIGSKLKKRQGRPIGFYKDTWVAKVATIVTSVISAILPVAAVLILFYVKPTPDRIYIMLGLTSLFAFALAIFTSAKHQEIFAATAAFAAVEVVFIGSVNDSSNTVVAVFPNAAGAITTTLSATSTSSASASAISSQPVSSATAAATHGARASAALVSGISAGLSVAAILLAVLLCVYNRRRQQNRGAVRK